MPQSLHPARAFVQGIRLQLEGHSRFEAIAVGVIVNSEARLAFVVRARRARNNMAQFDQLKDLNQHRNEPRNSDL